MRNRFEQQFVLGKLLIEDTIIPTAKRIGPLPALYAALKEIFVNPEWNEKIFKILDDAILSENNHTGRPGMNLWQIFVLAQVRLCQNISYDDLHYAVNSDRILRQLIGIESNYEYSQEVEEISYQRIKDNVGLLTDETVKQLNSVIVDFGHHVYKKKEEEVLLLKTDSFVVESNVSFPSDYKLLWDASRKAIDMVLKLLGKYEIKGWRKIGNWREKLKKSMHSLGRASASGGKGKEERLKMATEKYLTKAKALLLKLQSLEVDFQPNNLRDMAIILELERYIEYIEKHIDLVDRRLLKGEKIPHSEKMFSIFETYTEWIAKGKKRPSVELGKKVGITTDQYNLILDYQVMENEADSAIVPELVKRVLPRFSVWSWSFDKGYWNKNNKILLSESIDTVVLPKKGKCNKIEAEEEKSKIFRKLRNKHSAVESNINELENRGLDRCPDRSYEHFKRYIGLAVSAYNLRKIGAELIEHQRKKKKALARKKAV